ncbi:rhomboid family intramembrane serine protease [bacterium]|nr:rhomboid family intramembrane serine protease [bacterium]
MARITQYGGGGGGRMRFLTPIQVNWWSGARLSLGIIIANCAIWFLLVIGGKLNGNLHSTITYFFAISPETTFQKLYFWSLITYSFLHFGFWHLFYNMLFILFFSPQIERDLGPRKFAIFYLVCAIGAALVSLLAKTIGGIDVPTIGASGAVMGILIAYGLSYPYQTIYFWGIFPIKMWTLILVIIVIQLAMAIQDGLNSYTDYWAHLGGLMTGFIYMKLLTKSNRKPKPPSKRTRNWRGEETGEERSYYLEI